MSIKGPAKQAGADSIAEHTSFLGLKFKIGLVRAEFHRLATAVELKRPRAGDDGGFEFELASESGSDGTDALNGLVARPFCIHQSGVKSTDGDRRLVDDVNDDHDDVFIVVVNFHLHRCQVGVQGTCSGTVLVTHVASPVTTDGQLYFKGLPQQYALSAIGGEFPKAGTNPQQQRCGA